MMIEHQKAARTENKKHDRIFQKEKETAKKRLTETAFFPPQKNARFSKKSPSKESPSRGI